MESSNLHHLQDHPPPVHTSLSTPSCFGVGSTRSWTPNTTSNGGNLNPNFQEANPIRRSRAIRDSMIQGLGYEWGSGGAGSYLSSECDDDNHLSHLHYSSYSKIKEEISDAFPKFTEMLNTTSAMDLKDFNALSDKLLLKTLSSGDLYSNNTSASLSGMGMGMGVPTRGSFSQIYPSINISNLNQSSSPPPPMSCSLDMNMQCSDLSATFNGGFTHPSQHGLIPRFNDNLSFRLHHMQQPAIHGSSSTSCNSSNPSHFTNVMAETKRPNTLVESKASQSQTVPKKSRLESRSSCPPFKVRKEKLGDRIAALQQLVAPFGKTDTASVLMEAIGYIKFLQNQVETLSVPYMKSSRKQTNRATQGVSGIEEAKEEPKLDLRSRGLCLVPLSCMSYFTGDGASGVWQQSDFGGAT